MNCSLLIRNLLGYKGDKEEKPMNEVTKYLFIYITLTATGLYYLV